MDLLARMIEALRGVTWLRFVAAPLLGAVIGYITNDLALKMLFRPYEEKHIGRFHVPFTPGLIPQQKSRIARSLGGVIAGKLLDAETLSREALSPETLEKLRGAISGWLIRQAENEQPLRERIETRVPPEKLDEWQGKLTERTADFLMEKLREAGLGALVAEQVMTSIHRRLEHIPMGALLQSAVEPLRGNIAATVERKLNQAGPKLLRKKLLEAEDELLGKSVASLTEAHRDRIPEITNMLLGLYQELLEKNIGSLLQAARLDEIITRKIESFDARELERVIFGVARRELRAIVYLGAALGFLMGFVNLLF